MDPLSSFGDFRSGLTPGSLPTTRLESISPRLEQQRPSLQRMAGEALLRLIPRVTLPAKVIDAGPVAPGTLDEARRLGLL